jgi:hypothetical protein
MPNTRPDINAPDRTMQPPFPTPYFPNSPAQRARDSYLVSVSARATQTAAYLQRLRQDGDFKGTGKRIGRVGPFGHFGRNDKEGNRKGCPYKAGGMTAQ